MIAWLAARTGLPQLAIAGILALALAGATATAAALAMSSWRGALADARLSGIAERDAHWQAAMARSEATVAEARTVAAKAALDAELRAAADRAALDATMTQLEKANAALPNADACGLDADRRRLLP